MGGVDFWHFLHGFLRISAHFYGFLHTSTDFCTFYGFLYISGISLDFFIALDFWISARFHRISEQGVRDFHSLLTPQFHALIICVYLSHVAIMKSLNGKST